MKISRNLLIGLIVILSLFSLIRNSNDKEPTGYTKENLNNFLNGILSGTRIGLDLDDFKEIDIDYEDLSDKVESLLENYQSEDESDILQFLQGYSEILQILDTQAEMNNLEGPTADLLAKFSVPLMASGEITFTFRTSLIIHEASVSDYFYKGEKVNLENLNSLGDKLGNLAAKVYYDGKYDFNALFPEADNLRILDEKPTFITREYSMFEGKSLFEIRNSFLGSENPNHENFKKLQDQYKVSVIEESQDDGNSLRYLQDTTSNYDFRNAFPKCVLPVRNQGRCGSCWAQSAAGVMEKRVCRLSNSSTNQRLSPQHLVNCSTMDKGCRGGGLYGSWIHLQNKGITKEQCTPYTGRDETCLNTCKDGSPFERIKTINGSMVLIRKNVEKTKQYILNHGPVQHTFVKIFRDFLSYGGGIYKTNGQNFLGYHAMQIVGWGENYWIVENSWGSGWGENGHVRMAFDTAGASDYVIFATPIVKKPEVKCPENCESCEKEGVCSPDGCSSGFRSENGKCVPCPKNCKECESNSCPSGQCKDGFKTDTTGQCVPCEANCQKCSSKGCTTCNKNLIPNSEGKCVPCPKNCKVCESEICPEGKCYDKFFNDTEKKQCMPCANNCQSCTSKGCGKCQEGFIPNPNGVCVPCPQNCSTCTQEKCPSDKCKNGFFMDTNKGQCMPCLGNCETCDMNGCQKCKTGFELKDKKCMHVKCPTGCAKCQGDICSACDDGLSLHNGKCLKCPNNCTKCDQNGKCLECKKPLFLNNGECKDCPSNCEKCQNGKCVQCPKGLIINGKGECSKCDENCRYCSKWGCWRCNLGYRRSRGQCIKCPENCAYCTSSRCYRCMPRFFRSNNTCQKCPDNCRYCRYGRCFLCDKGFGVSNGTCKKCPENCNRCNGNGCYRWGCNVGFSYNNGQCKQCDPNCLSCSRYGCRRCKYGFFIKNGGCEKCQSPCLSCNSRRCYRCPAGYRPNGNGCMKCPENCRVCNSRGCYRWGCNQGFSITKDLQCQKCPDNCKRCNSYGCHPRGCEKGYGNNMGRPRICEKCPENCAFCYRGKCYRCNLGLSVTRDRKQCLDAGKNCRLANNNSTCYRCMWRFEIKNGQCEPCSANCRFCRNGKCWYCDRGYKRNSNYQCVRR